MVFCFVVQLCLILDQCRFFTELNEGTSEIMKVNVFDKVTHIISRRVFWNTYEKLASQRLYMRRFKLDTRERTLNTIRELILLLTELACAALNIVLIHDYANILLPTGNGAITLDLTAWSLGQVISVTIWVPVLLEYFWLASSKSFTHHPSSIILRPRPQVLIDF